MPPKASKRDAKAVAIQSPNTPEHDARPQAPTITVAQKQALIDNLQLEISERARKLRAQYALHAQGLRSRLEMRINRIPQTLRASNVEDLINKYAEALEPPKAPKALPATKPVLSRTTTASSKTSAQSQASSPLRRGLKRDSTEMIGQSDKENQQNDLDLPKKRTRTGAGPSEAPSKQPARGVSRKVDPSKVLSPKSHNSRTLPQSPFVRTSPGKSGLARPVSPIKPGTVAAATASLASMVSGGSKPPSRATSKQTGATGSVRGRGAKNAGAGTMGPPALPASRAGTTRGVGRPATRNSNSSLTSDSSSQTTIVKKPRGGAGGVVRKAVSKATGMTASAASKRTANAKKEVPAPTATGTGGRVLRARR